MTRLIGDLYVSRPKCLGSNPCLLDIPCPLPPPPESSCPPPAWPPWLTHPPWTPAPLLPSWFFQPAAPRQCAPWRPHSCQGQRSRRQAGGRHGWRMRQGRQCKNLRFEQYFSLLSADHSPCPWLCFWWRVIPLQFVSNIFFRWGFIPDDLTQPDQGLYPGFVSSDKFGWLTWLVLPPACPPWPPWAGTGALRWSGAGGGGEGGGRKPFRKQNKIENLPIDALLEVLGFTIFSIYLVCQFEWH